LHGCSQTARDFAIGTRMDRLAEEQGVIVAYPDQPRSANMLKSWNWFRDSDQHRGRGEPSILAGLTQRIMEDFDVDPARVYVAGLSSGGAAAAVMAKAYPDIYAAVGIHSGLASGAAGSMAAALSTMRRGAVRQPLRTAHPVPTIVFHGDRDTTVAPRQSSPWSKSLRLFELNYRTIRLTSGPSGEKQPQSRPPGCG
ncbi:PHB depolymerase family esterase, partial [Methylobacterium sp. E-025]|uniref:extracellular catalytic domain type 1 short-chain-length polyhydroxyalkanoate depolymerase n=1 Tax=Methylobacterium sp. E-025 TaxID=2836561 RepID=UPI001FBAAE39